MTLKTWILTWSNLYSFLLPSHKLRQLKQLTLFPTNKESSPNWSKKRLRLPTLIKNFKMLKIERSNNWSMLKLIIKRTLLKKSKRIKLRPRKMQKKLKKEWRKKNTLITKNFLLKSWTKLWFKLVMMSRKIPLWTLSDLEFQWILNSFKWEAQSTRKEKELTETLPQISSVQDQKWVTNWSCSEAFKILQLLPHKLAKEPCLNSKYKLKL